MNAKNNNLSLKNEISDLIDYSEALEFLNNYHNPPKNETTVDHEKSHVSVRKKRNKMRI